MFTFSHPAEDTQSTAPETSKLLSLYFANLYIFTFKHFANVADGCLHFHIPQSLNPETSETPLPGFSPPRVSSTPFKMLEMSNFQKRKAFNHRSFYLLFTLKVDKNSHHSLIRVVADETLI